MESDRQPKPGLNGAPSAIRTVPLSEAIGVEIIGMDVRDDISQEMIDAIRDAWHRNGIILIRGQALDEAAQVRFAQSFGDLGTVQHRHNGRSGLPGVMYISNIRENGELIGALPDGEMCFNSDQCYIEHPSVGTMLYAMEIPSKGGDTIFGIGDGAESAPLLDRLNRRCANLSL